MAVSTIHKLDKIRFNNGGWELNELTNVSLAAELQTLIQFPAGHVYPLKTSPMSQAPALRFTTPEIDVVAINIPAEGVAITADSILYHKLGTATGSVARVTASHTTHTIAECFVYWERISLPHNGQGTADVVVIPVYDGTNEPIVPAGSAALQGNLAAGDNFGVGPLTVNAAALAGIQSIDYASNLQPLILGSGSELWPTFAGCQSVQPTATVRTLTASGFSTYGLDGTALSGAAGAFTSYARKYRVSNATTQHVKITATDGHIYPIDIGGGGTGVTTDTIRVEFISPDDSTAALTLADGLAIT